MSFRTVVVKNRAKIETRLNYLLIRGEEEKWIHISEIGTLIVESTACAITTQALCELAKNKTNIIFCDEKHLPYGQMSMLYAHHLSSGQIKRQAMWPDELKAKAWKEIVTQKIDWQRVLLVRYQKFDAAHLLSEYILQVDDGDLTNREGHAAKVYFNALFGQDFCRRTENEITATQNYGFAILMSNFAREIIAAGYVTQIGIHHINEFNQFNLASDIMEPFRPLVDAYVLAMTDFENFKSKISAILTAKVRIEGKEYFLDTAIRIYTRNVLKFMEGSGKISKIERFIMGEGNEL